jgi:hypothetical protein
MRRTLAGCLAVVLIACLTAPAAAGWRPAPPTRTVVYEVGDLLYRPGGHTGFDRVDDISRIILTTIDPEAWGPGPTGSTLVELQGKRLEITTTAARHAEIKDLLAALRRMQDVAVTLSGDLYEVDRVVFEQEFQPRFAKARRTPEQPVALSLDDNLEALLRRHGKVVRQGSVTIPDRREGVFFSLRQPFTFIARRVGRQDRPVREIADHGFSARASIQVSPDRRFVTLRLTQQASELIALRPKADFNRDNGNEVLVESPDLVDVTVAVTTTVADGESLMLAVPYRPQAVRDRDRVLVLLVHVRIYIEEEQRMLGNNPP